MEIKVRFISGVYVHVTFNQISLFLKLGSNLNWRQSCLLYLVESWKAVRIRGLFSPEYRVEWYNMLTPNTKQLELVNRDSLHCDSYNTHTAVKKLGSIHRWLPRSRWSTYIILLRTMRHRRHWLINLINSSVFHGLCAPNKPCLTWRN